MNIDLPPFAAFALQSSPAPERHSAESHTLTLRLSRPALYSSFGAPMNGSARMLAAPMRCGGVLRAAVLPSEGPALTITF